GLARRDGLQLGGGLGNDGRQVSGEIAGARLWPGAHELDGERAQALEARSLLRRVLRREQGTPAHAQAIDQSPEEAVWLDGVELGGGGAVQLDEALDALARLGRHLRGLGCGA